MYFFAALQVAICLSRTFVALTADSSNSSLSFTVETSISTFPTTIASQTSTLSENKTSANGTVTSTVSSQQSNNPSTSTALNTSTFKSMNTDGQSITSSVSCSVSDNLSTYSATVPTVSSTADTNANGTVTSTVSSQKSNNPSTSTAPNTNTLNSMNTMQSFTSAPTTSLDFTNSTLTPPFNSASLTSTPSLVHTSPLNAMSQMRASDSQWITSSVSQWKSSSFSSVPVSRNVCTPSFCKNGGICTNETQSSDCYCKLNYYGSTCEKYVGDLDKNTTLYKKLTFAFAGTTGFLLLVIIFMIFCRSQQHNIKGLDYHKELDDFEIGNKRASVVISNPNSLKTFDMYSNGSPITKGSDSETKVTKPTNEF